MNTESILACGRAFMECRILLSAAELDLFTLLSDAPLSAEEVTERVGGDARAITMLLDALAALEFITKREGRYRCQPDSARLLSAKSPHSVMPMLGHYASLWHSWSELTGIARGDREALRRAQAQGGDTCLAAFIGGMHVVAGPLAEALVAAVEPESATRLLDVGGASGTYTLAFLEAAPHLRASLFDRPAVIEMARERLEKAGVLERVELLGGDFGTDELPPGHDLALLSAIIHQNSRAQNVELYGKVWRALLPGGRLVIRDHVMSPDRTRPARGAVFAINMLVRTEGGNVYTLAQIEEDLLAAGFERVRQIQTDERMSGLVEAFKPHP